MNISAWFHPLAAVLLVTPACASPVPTSRAWMAAMLWSASAPAALFISERDSTLLATLKNIFHFIVRFGPQPRFNPICTTNQRQ